jgi:hypothetical protein
MEYIAEERLVLCVDNAREGKQFEGFGRRSVVVCGEGKEMCWPRNEKASSAGSGRRNESTDGALGDAKFCSTKRKAGCRTRSIGELSDTRNFNGIRITSHFVFFYTTLSCNLQSTSTSKIITPQALQPLQNPI